MELDISPRQINLRRPAVSEREKSQPGRTSSSVGDESLDSLLKAVARVPSVPLGPDSTVSGLSRTALAHTSSGPIPVLPAEGTVLGGRYELLSMLGAGGMGAVYAARNLRTGKEVAVKVLLPEQQARSDRGHHLQHSRQSASSVRRARPGASATRTWSMCTTSRATSRCRTS